MRCLFVRLSVTENYHLLKLCQGEVWDVFWDISKKNWQVNNDNDDEDDSKDINHGGDVVKSSDW